jgi:nucleoid DNA-binding protein
MAKTKGIIDIRKEVAKRTRLPVTHVTEVLDAYTDVVVHYLQRYEVHLPKIGTLYMYENKAKPLKNPYANGMSTPRKILKLRRASTAPTIPIENEKEDEQDD